MPIAQVSSFEPRTSWVIESEPFVDRGMDQAKLPSLFNFKRKPVLGEFTAVLKPLTEIVPEALESETLTPPSEVDNRSVTFDPVMDVLEVIIPFVDTFFTIVVEPFWSKNHAAEPSFSKLTWPIGSIAH